MTTSIQSIPLLVRAATDRPRTNEPVTCGIPWSRGALFDPGRLRLLDEEGNPLPLQTQVLDTWPDGSVRWLLLDWQATFAKTGRFQLAFTESKQDPIPDGLRIRRVRPGSIQIQTGKGFFEFANQQRDVLFRCQFQDSSSNGQQVNCRLTGEDGKGAAFYTENETLEVEENGPLRACIKLTGACLLVENRQRLMNFVLRVHLFHASATVRTHFTLHNSRKAEHPNGLWDLGNGGSIYLRDASIELVSQQCAGATSGAVASELEHSLTRFQSTCEIYQDSSGGEHWQSKNHLNRLGQVPHTFRGYRLNVDQHEHDGLRATPVVWRDCAESMLGVAMPAFWQNFPKAMESTRHGIILRLFPRQFSDVHELQGGEQKTHVCFLAFGPDSVCGPTLDWCRSPAIASSESAWYCQTGVVAKLTPRADDPHHDYSRLVDAAIEGADTFVHKRERIDEYGWRHFGDIYGDHESAFTKGDSPLISHYNNQYDAIAGLGYQFLRSGDVRWFGLMNDLAAHVTDIDLYHTWEDKAAYNQGLFWHTYHYVEADTGTHRSYPSRPRLPPDNRPLPGGGPADEQNYAAGFSLHYYLTGDRQSRESALQLAQWVIDMDDGAKTIFRWLSRGDTGLASQSRTPSYHGPGRGAANSINVLLEGHRLTREARFLIKAEQLIRRCIHPDDDVAGRRLLDTENRWFYTMFLQALGNFLHYKEEWGQLDQSYAYARASLLHYARWMADHEYPYLTKPELLEYPTETWAAQDMRKSEIFHLAWLCSRGPERERFRERAQFFYDYVVRTLQAMPTRTLCRPVVLMLNFGFQQAWYQSHPQAELPDPSMTEDSFGEPSRFIPQKQIALRRARMGVYLAVFCSFALGCALLLRWLY